MGEIVQNDPPPMVESASLWSRCWPRLLACCCRLVGQEAATEARPSAQDEDVQAHGSGSSQDTGGAEDLQASLTNTSVQERLQTSRVARYAYRWKAATVAGSRQT